MFKRDHHVRIATVLQSLNGPLLFKRGCYFGGGTAIVLSHGEYRESIDIDFLISNIEGYRELRQSLKIKNDLSPIIRQDLQIKLSRDIRSDQYGIRTMIHQAEMDIKFEIVFEGRISLEIPRSTETICGIQTLTKLDFAASKLLANSDRWADSAVYSRDLIDLAILDLTTKEYRQALEKAESAYGESILNDLKKAIKTLKSRPGRLAECMSALKIDTLPEALLWEKIRKL